MKKTFALLLTIALLSGCASLLPKGPPAAKLYTLNPAPIAQSNTPRLPVNLQILMPQASPGLESERVAVRKDDNQIDYYAGIRWASNLNTLVQSLVVESFDNSHALKSVGNDLIAMNPTHNLLIEIRDFQVEDNKTHVRLVVKLMKTDTQQVIMTRSYDEKAAIENNDVAHIMKSFDKAYQQAAGTMVTDIISQLNSKNRK